MNDLPKGHEGLPPFLPNWVLGTGIGVLVASVCASVYCLAAAENVEEGQNTTIPKPSHSIIEVSENR